MAGGQQQLQSSCVDSIPKKQQPARDLAAHARWSGVMDAAAVVELAAVAVDARLVGLEAAAVVQSTLAVFGLGNVVRVWPIAANDFVDPKIVADCETELTQASRSNSCEGVLLELRRSPVVAIQETAAGWYRNPLRVAS